MKTKKPWKNMVFMQQQFIWKGDDKVCQDNALASLNFQ